ncbi:cytochrome b N-terminal domain-containing protein [Desulforhopalus sp. 52FAK]
MLSQCKKGISQLAGYGVDTFYQIKWGAWSLIALYFSIVSGIIVGLQYDYSTPYYSSSALDILIPYGYYFRSLHFYTSQFFFFFTCFHLIAIYQKTEDYKPVEWIKLIATIPVIILLLFTGYILRGDSTGASAGMIAESIVHTIPILGNVIDSILLSVDNSGLRKVYVQHVVGLDVILFILLWSHLRIYRIKLVNYLHISAVMLLFSSVIYAPMDPEKLGTTYIAGPWFFLGLQELLRYFDPVIAGVIVPIIFVGLIFSIQPSHPKHKLYIKLLFFFLLIYAGLTVVAYIR